MNQSLIDPISDTQPCGIDYKYEDAYLAIEQEVDRDSSAAEDTFTDWSLVVSECESILSEQSKDIKVLSWWVFGLWHRHGLSSLVDSIVTLAALIENYKSEMFPTSARIKLNVLTSLDTFLTESLLDEKTGLQNFHQLTALHDAFEKCFLAIQEGLETEDLFFRKIRETCKRYIKEAEAKAALDAKNAAAAAENGDITNDSDANKVLNPIKKNIQSLNKYWRGENASDLRAIKMTRILSWLDIDALPESDGKKTAMNPPSHESFETIEELQAAGKFEEAFLLTEELMHYAPFWVDGHVKSYELLMAMEATDSAEYVLQTLIAFVQVHKGILDLSYADGTPFASLKSKELIAFSLPSGMGGSGDSEVDLIAVAKDEALGFMKKKKLREGMQVVEKAYREAEDEEMRFKVRLLHAELAVDVGELEVARALLDDLRQQIDTFGLDLWKPSLAAQVYALYLGSFDRTQFDMEHLAVMYSRLCKIDIAQALSIA